mmetsp:Transcript_13298/g.28429  ORF Transcript_13298/g.28429 Transcript_13298/m.28429 type:complete len:92 (-) Transcript_13298:77-352(-)
MKMGRKSSSTCQTHQQTLHSRPWNPNSSGYNTQIPVVLFSFSHASLKSASLGCVVLQFETTFALIYISLMHLKFNLGSCQPESNECAISQH